MLFASVQVVSGCRPMGVHLPPPRSLARAPCVCLLRVSGCRPLGIRPPLPRSQARRVCIGGLCEHPKTEAQLYSYFTMLHVSETKTGKTYGNIFVVISSGKVPWQQRHRIIALKRGLHVTSALVVMQRATPCLLHLPMWQFRGALGAPGVSVSEGTS